MRYYEEQEKVVNDHIVFLENCLRDKPDNLDHVDIKSECGECRDVLEADMEHFFGKLI